MIIRKFDLPLRNLLRANCWPLPDFWVNRVKGNGSCILSDTIIDIRRLITNHGPLGLIPLMAPKRDAQSSKRVFSIRQEFLLEPRGVLRHPKSIIVACSKLELEIKASYFEAHFTNPSSQSLLERPHPSYASSQMRKP
jgi:hypothetical protein